MQHLTIKWPSDLDPANTSSTVAVVNPKDDPVGSLKHSGQSFVGDAQALAGVWLLVVIMGIGAWLLSRRGAKLTAAASTLVVVFVAVVLIFSPEWVLSIMRGFGVRLAPK